ncbi:hypothetical protein [Hymenobacter lucidus]|uniref:Uncharacterized protein n=1 Tax=Hymenobacter lucidus TaxID=2880930 RepID=A0ABS8AUZ4_9BACT|nr:hypothetical protein [Hymenobacter lucidus]MCB2409813.1 hypothetical protein [Hymenobacter lucidus]
MIEAIGSEEQRDAQLKLAEEIRQADIQRQSMKEVIDICKDNQKASGQEFDKLLVYIAGGGLALTVGFVKDIVSITNAKYLWLLFLTWVSFTLTLLFNLISHKLAATASDESLSLWSYRKHCFDFNKEIDNDYDKKLDTKANWANDWVSRLNDLSIASTIIGISFFIVFTFINLNNGRPTEPRKPEPSPIAKINGAEYYQRIKASVDSNGSSSIRTNISTSVNDSSHSIK